MSKTPRIKRSHLPLWLEIPLVFLAKMLYRVRVRGIENLPLTGGAILVSNHLSYVDGALLQLACPRPIRFMGYEGFARTNWFFHWLFRLSGTIAVSPSKSLGSTRAALKYLQAGDLLCVFPEGGISRTGQLLALNTGFELLARKAKVPIVPVIHDGIWGSVFSFAGNKYLWKSPRLMPTNIFVVYGKSIPADRIELPAVRKVMLDMVSEAFHERPILRRNLGREAVRALAKHPFHTLLIDYTTDRTEMSSGKILAAASALSRHIRKTIPDKRVGIVLPPGIGGTIANLAVAAADKVPVNLNFTAGRASLESALRIGEVRTIITADAVKAKFPQFPWPEDSRDLKGMLAAAGGKRTILRWLIAIHLLPNQLIASLLGTSKTGDYDEACLLFTSGSSGEPKGVALTHRNILANCSQISSTSVLPSSGTLLGCLPIFHSFGSTVTIWYAILRGCRVVSVPSPLDTRKIIDAIKNEKATLLVTAPTFLRPFLKKAESSELKSLELVVTGAEKLPLDLYEAFLREFHIEIMQGYGITETSPVINVNQPDPPLTTSTAEPQFGKRLGSVGRLLPGITARITDPDTGAELPINTTGMLSVKGDNVFSGYLKDPEKTAAAIRDGWFITGDLGRFDDQGFLYIEGRLSRFSKIGGEMVPHGTVEQKIMECFGWIAEETPSLAVVGIPDQVKGEQLVLVTTKEIRIEEIREKLLAAGLPALWVPKSLRRVETIPLLGSGKLDLKSCKGIAMQIHMTEATAGDFKRVS